MDGGPDSSIPTPPDARPDATPDATPPSMGDAAVPGDEAAAYQAVDQAIALVLCACNFMEAGFASAEECRSDVMANADSDAEVACIQAGYDASPVVAAYNGCLVPILDTYRACVEAAMCDEAATMACGSDVDRAAMGRCTQPEAADYGPYQAAMGECASGTAGSESCPEGMSSMLGESIFMGDTFLAGDDVTPSCIVEGEPMTVAPDRSFQWTAPAAGDYVIDTVGSRYDTALVVRDGCGAMAMEVACNDDIDTPGRNYRSRVMVTATEGQVFIITVDGYSASWGSFVVNIAAAGAGGG